jgi:phosphatidylserine/phosphatidylglycerophosphate/cardiolipin synthase-like enzyme
MSRSFRGVAVAALVLAATLAAAQAGKPGADTASVEAYFTPGDDADKQIIAVLRGAQREVLALAYVFTHREIASALVGARRRGVQVSVIADRGQAERFSGWLLRELADGGVHVYLDGEHEAAHSKVIIVDAGLPGATVITGSYNFTYGAQYRNSENLLILSGNDNITMKFAEDWRKHRKHSVRFPP